MNLVIDLSHLVKGHFELTSEQNDAFLNTADVADILNLSVRTIQRYAHSGIIKYKKVGGTNFYLKSDVFALLKNR
ncbi:helix-turn-helix domain-containing protein [Pedobacter hartonius]|nr:helix-turn-helix domain-containing protein [Pedobacter hartonius]